MDFSKYMKRGAANCESCQFYQYDDYTDSYTCSLSLDEDEMASFVNGMTRDCKYYRYYDEYKSVQTQI